MYQENLPLLCLYIIVYNHTCIKKTFHCFVSTLLFITIHVSRKPSIACLYIIVYNHTCIKKTFHCFVSTLLFIIVHVSRKPSIALSLHYCLLSYMYQENLPLLCLYIIVYNHTCIKKTFHCFVSTLLFIIVHVSRKPPSKHACIVPVPASSGFVLYIPYTVCPYRPSTVPVPSY